MYIFVIDFEATCWEDKVDFNEIIEFPCVVIDAGERRVVEEFHRYIKPVFRPQLSKFCTQLTGITQGVVERGISFREATDLFRELYQKYYELSNWEDVPLIITCGNWDFNHAYPINCKAWKMNNEYRKWCDVKEVFKKCYQKRPKGMIGMLNSLDLGLIGRHHSGICDAHNIARIVIRMIEDGYLNEFRPASI